MKVSPYVNCKRNLILVLFTLVCTIRVNAQTGIDTLLSNALQRSIDSMKVSYNVKGISAAAYIPGRGMWKGVTGVSYDVVPYDTTMLQSIGSITKTFVAAEIFKLVEAGDLSLSDTVGALLPPMSYVNPGITVQQLLGHTSGMGDFITPAWQSAMSSDPYAIWYFPAALAAFCAPATGAPGSAWNYRNANYSLLGMIIEAKKGDSLHHVLRNDFLLPYHLDNMHMEIFEPYTNPIPHNWATPTLNPALAVDASATPHQALWSSVEAAGGYFSDAANLAQWGYDLYSGAVLSPAYMSQMLTFTSVSAGYFNGYGLGVMRFPAYGRTCYGHAGNYYGYAASMIYYPVDSICVAVLINQDCIAVYEANKLMNTLITKIATGIKDITWADKIVISPNPANNEMAISVPVNNKPLQVTICNVAGRELYNTKMKTNTITISTSAFDPGEYFIKISSDGQVVTEEVVVQH